MKSPARSQKERADMTAAYIIILSLLFISYLFTAIGRSKMFVKAGEKAWKAFIPFYSEYTLYRLTWIRLMYFLRLWLIAFSNLADPKTSGQLAQAVALILAILAITISVISSLRTARSYGKGTAFGLGLIFLPPVFSMIAGFDAKIFYVGRWDSKNKIFTDPEKKADLFGDVGKTVSAFKELFKKGR